MSQQQNVEIVRKGYEAFGRGDIDTLLSLFDENIEWTTPGPPELPTAGTRRGPQQVAEFFRLLDNVFEIQRFEPKAFISEGDRVVVLGDDTSRIKATAAGRQTARGSLRAAGPALLERLDRRPRRR